MIQFTTDQLAILRTALCGRTTYKTRLLQDLSGFVIYDQVGMIATIDRSCCTHPFLLDMRQQGWTVATHLDRIMLWWRKDRAEGATRRKTLERLFNHAIDAVQEG
jgi:hypothetical protein